MVERDQKGDTAPGLDVQVSAFLEEVNGAGLPPLYKLSPEEARRQYEIGIDAVAGEIPQIGEIEDFDAVGPQGAIPMRLYRPLVAPVGLPVLVYFHGGGWSFGSINSADHVCRWLVKSSDYTVISVDYRLGPEHKFPAAVNDAVAAVAWVSKRASDLGLDPERLAVGGDSAGANLATVASMLLRGHEFAKIRYQLLIYPATDLTMEMPSHKMFGEGYRLTRPLMLWSAANYLRDGRDIKDPRASPLFAESLEGMPSALLVTAGFDPLRDEGKAYADKLEAAGVAVEYLNYDGMIHAFIGMTGIFDTARLALEYCGRALRKALAEVQVWESS